MRLRSAFEASALISLKVHTSHGSEGTDGGLLPCAQAGGVAAQVPKASAQPRPRVPGGR